MCTDVNHSVVPAVAYLDYWAPVFSLNASYTEYLHNLSSECGYTDYLNEYLVYPPVGILPTPPNATNEACDVWTMIYYAAVEIQPCFDVYQILTTCPLLWDVLGFPGSIPYEPVGASIYFNRSDVQAAINAPPTNWQECAPNVFVNNTDNSPPSGLSILPSVIERTNKTIIGHGALDFLLIANGTLLMIQNMTWNGAQGFTSAPSDEFFVPYHIDYNNEATLAGAGVFGTYHTERGLTFVEVSLSGHSKHNRSSSDYKYANARFSDSSICAIGCVQNT